MKLHELFENRLLMESGVTLREVNFLKDLKDPSTKKYYTSEVNVTGDVNLEDKKLAKLPVQFGKVGGDFNCAMNELTSFEGAPREVGGDLIYEFNKLTSLEGVHKIIKSINGTIRLATRVSAGPIKSGGIGLILIDGLKGIYGNQPAFKIINKYLGQGKKGLLLAQDELDEAGYEEFAKL